MKHVAILGSTGSIGVSSLDVLRTHSDRFRVDALCAGTQWQVLARQCHEFRPRIAVLADLAVEPAVDRAAFPIGTQLVFGPDAVQAVAAAPENSIVVSAIVGAAGLKGTWAAVEAGKRVALANKETLVVAGPLITEMAQKTGAELLPVDSEHSAIFQCLAAGRQHDVAKVWLTASGGPFRTATADDLENVTVEQALRHPTWTMGRKITIDSATMMNKALELIEARWLFGLDADQLGVVVHPQSVIHSMVEYRDGSTLAQLSPPDMKLPIQYALTYPERLPGCSPVMDWQRAVALQFQPPNLDLFPAIRLGFEVARRGGTAGAVLNAANEVAVGRFLDGTLRFVEICRVVESVLTRHVFNANPTLGDLLDADGWAREETRRWMV